MSNCTVALLLVNPGLIPFAFSLVIVYAIKNNLST